MELLYIGEGGPCHYYFCSQVINILIIHLCTRGKFQEQIFMKKSPCHGISFCFANRRIHGPAKRLLTQVHYIYIGTCYSNSPFSYSHIPPFLIKIPLKKTSFSFVNFKKKYLMQKKQVFVLLIFKKIPQKQFFIILFFCTKWKLVGIVYS